MSATLVFGGVRSGKSRHAEWLLRGHDNVTYIATGPAGAGAGEDPEWQARVQAHQDARPAGWTTVETSDVLRAAMAARGPVLVDCLGGWVTALIDEAAAWDDPARAEEIVAARLEELALVVNALPSDVVLVTNEVGMGIVPATASGRLFRDLLGRANTRLSAACDAVLLVIAGRVLDISGAPLVAS